MARLYFPGLYLCYFAALFPLNCQDKFCRPLSTYFSGSALTNILLVLRFMNVTKTNTYFSFTRTYFIGIRFNLFATEFRLNERKLNALTLNRRRSNK